MVEFKRMKKSSNQETTRDPWYTTSTPSNHTPLNPFEVLGNCSFRGFTLAAQPPTISNRRSVGSTLWISPGRDGQCFSQSVENSG